MKKYSLKGDDKFILNMLSLKCPGHIKETIKART